MTPTHEDGPARPVPSQVADSEPAGAGAFVGPVWSVPVNGVELGYRQFGSGPDLLMITGDTAPMSLWTPYLLEALAASFRVTILDDRGTGRSSDDPSVPLSIEVMAQDTAGLIETLGLHDVTLVGWSMGGEIALTMAALEIGAAGIGRIVTSGGDAGSPETIQPSADLLAQLADPTTSDEADMNLMFPSSAAGQAALSRFLKGLGSVPQDTPTPEILQRQANAETDFLETREAWDRLDRIRVPVLITNGELDPGVPAANAETLAERIPGARLSIYTGSSHGMMFQDAERFAAEVAAFHDATR